MSDHETIDSCRHALVQRLLAARDESGHWVGELSSSALSTATAVVALRMARREPERVSQGLAWLARQQNADGGWGDTVDSPSNISTTALCWGAFAGEDADPVVGRAESWLSEAAGGLEPEQLSRAIASRYGRDRTFSVPILMMLALTGRLGSDGWRYVAQLPFELAAFPRRWFRTLRLPVVSYAIPALIAIGQLRHHQRPTRNPLSGWLRNRARRRTLRVLEEVQPSSGGFLEATPLTSFVVMSLIGAGQADSPVVQQGLRFLLDSVRADGCWPIDTDLATWVTTLSIKALSRSGELESLLTGEERTVLRDWLVGQQYREEHPYTLAPSGGWAWTDLPGGVPDADDTAGALLALRVLGPIDDTMREAARAGAAWLVGLQNRDGGVPTFCRGWGALPFDRSTPDLTAHAVAAWVAWQDLLGPGIGAVIARAVRYLGRSQRPDGAWVPLWFGNQRVVDQENPTYGTARVLLALRGLEGTETMVEGGDRWLLSAQNADGGWGGSVNCPSSIEETALALESLAESDVDCDRLARGQTWLAEQTAGGAVTPAAPVGLYFAKLWYAEALYPLIFSAAALGACRKGHS